MILPKDVVTLLQDEFPAVLRIRHDAPTAVQEAYRARIILPGILRMIKEIPEELILVEPVARLKFSLAIAALENQLGQTGPGSQMGWPRLSDNTDCLKLIWDTLKQCPDEAPSKTTKGLVFITDNRHVKLY